MANDIERWQRRLKLVDEQRAERIRKAQQSSPAPVKPKYEYSTDNLSMLDLAGGAMTGVVSADVSENVVSAVAPFTGAVSTIVETASDTAAYLKGSNAYRKYLATDEEKKREAQVISIETGIPVNALLYSDENMAKGRSVQEYTKKRMALAPEGINDWDDMDAVYAKFPGLKEVVENPNMSDTDVAIAMHNIEDLTKAKSATEAFSLGYAMDKANYRIGELGVFGFAGGELTDEMKKEIASIKKSIPEQKSMPNLLDDPWVAIAGGTGANLYHMNKGIQRGSNLAATALATGVGVSVMSGGTLAAPAMGAAITTAGIGFRYGMAEDMFMNSAGRHYAEYSEMKSKDGKTLLTPNEARAFAAIAAGMETGVEFWNYGQIMNLLGANYKRDIMEIVAKASGDQAMLKAGMSQFIRERVLQAAKAGATEAAEEAVQDASDKAVHNAIVTYAPQAAYRKYTGTEFAKGALEASAEALPGIIGLGVIGGTVSNFKSVSDFARLQKEQNDIFFAEMKRANGLAMIKNLQANMAESKLFKKNPEIYQAAVKGAVENTEFKEVRVDTELALQDEEGAVVFNQLVEEMGLEQEEVNAIIENKADLIVPTEIYAQTVMNNDKFDRYISFDEKGHSAARKKYYMAVAEEMAKSISIEQEEKQAELIDGIITANFPEAGIEQDMGAAIILSNPSNPMQAWKQMKHDTETAINARLGNIVKKLEEGMSRGIHMYYSDEIGHPAKRMSDNDEWYSDFYKQHKRKPNKAELWEMAREIYKGGGERYQMPEYTFEATDEMQEDFDALDQDFANLDILNDIKGKVENLTASEMAVVRGLTPSGYKVYQAARKQFERGNADVQKAGRMNAILFARYADRMADNISKITGKPYTAEDYMRERTSIVADATEVEEGAYGQDIAEAKLKKDEADFAKTVDTWTKLPKRGESYVMHTPLALEIAGVAHLPIKIKNKTFEHILVKHKDSIGKEELKKIPRALTDPLFVAESNGNILVALDLGDKNDVSIVTFLLEKRDSTGNNANFILSSYGKDSAYGTANAVKQTDYKWFIDNFLNTNKIRYINKKKTTDWLREARLKPPYVLNKISSLSTTNIPNENDLRKRKKGMPTYYQTAYHGTPHTFDTFDLGAIGTGEGAQAHGWGLYFAQDKKVSEEYRRRLAGEVKESIYLGYKAVRGEWRDAEGNRASDVLERALNYLSNENGNVAATILSLKQAASKWNDVRLDEAADYLEENFASKGIEKTENEAKTPGELYEVDIPENDVLLDEQKPLKEQPPKVINALKEIGKRTTTGKFVDYKGKTYKYVKGSLFGDWVDFSTHRHVRKGSDLGKELDEIADSIYEKEYKYNIFNANDTGHAIYSKLVKEYGSLEEASRKLNEYGVKGITYEGYLDGRCFVVFDDKAISVIERYNQSVRGQTRISGMSRVVSLFESADKSTFVHELGHVALADLKMLAEMDGAPAQLVRDWQTVKEWLGYKDSQGFTREQHEKFARGFEAYLRTGEAPVRGLRAVFRTFKKWLCDIYADFVQLGGKPSAEVRAVMARMLASEQEIEAEAKVQGIESITKKKGMQILDDTTQAMYERWVREAKEEAKEKVLKIAMQDVSDEMEAGRQEIIKAMREDIEERLKEQDIFRAEECVRLSGSMDILPTLGYTEESYKAELEMHGGGLEKAVEKELAQAVEDMDSYTDVEATVNAEAEKALSSSKYKAMILTLEYEALERKEKEERRLDKSVDKALDEIEKSLRGEEEQPKDEGKEVKSLKQRIADLKYTYRWREAEMKLINQMQKQAAKVEAKQDKEEAVEKAVGKAKEKAEQDKAKILDTVKQLRDFITSSKEGIRLVRDAVEGQMDMYKRAAFMNLMYMPIRQATATYSWRHKERMKGVEVARLMAKGKWQEAKQAKREQVMFSYFADESAKLKADVDKKVNKLKKRSNSIAKGNVKLAADERYFYNHLLYVFGVNRRDAIMPQEWQGSESVDAMFKRYAKEYEAHFLDEDGEVDIPQFIKDAAGGNDVYKTQVNIEGRKNPVKALGYGALTKDEFDGLFDILTSVYTIGQNANRLFTVIDEDGKAVSFEDAVQRIADGVRKNVKAKANDDPTGMTLPTTLEKITAARDAAVGELIKPETIFRWNDGGKEGVSMMFLYDPIDRAANKEMRMQAQAAKAVHELFGKYREHRKEERYKLGTSVLTKEQVIVLALNWGTELNRKRVLDGFKKPDEQNKDAFVNLTEKDIEEVLGNLTAEDWQTVTGVWTLLESFWGDTVAIEERMTGVGIEKQQAVPFDIVGKDGTVYHLAGGYYPIMYDPTKSGRQQDLEKDDVAKMQMSGNAVLGTRRGFTKQRSRQTIERPIYTVLDPLPKALDDVIHNICYREAIRDVYKLINAQEVRVAIEEAYGTSTHRSLDKWVKDNWVMDEKKDKITKVAAFLRRNATMAVMGWRVTVAALNLVNIAPVTEYIGAGRTFAALRNFASDPVKEYQFCLEKSEFLAHRAETMDRDVREKLREIREGESKLPNLAGKVIRGAKEKIEWAEEHAFTLMAYTDLMFAAPLWKSEYERVYREGVGKGLSAENIERRAVAAGDAAVRRVFGSGDVKDLAPVQRSHEVAKQLTMFYSYMNTVFNALAFRYGRAVNAGEWMKFARSVLYWLILTKAMEEVLRALWGDDEEDMSERIKKVFDPAHMAQSFGEQVFGMIPIAREFFKVTVGVFMGERVYGAKMTSAYDVVDRAQRASQAIMSKKKDWIDVGREVTRASNSFTGWSDTITDGIWTFIRYADNDFDNDIGEVLKAIVFDKKIK
ncbi:MAG: hypothetical protein IJN28_05165 [Selenomonadales bacterium]|nr:hypothetical protein [Selenomonadales bacterium]